MGTWGGWGRDWRGEGNHGRSGYGGVWFFATVFFARHGIVRWTKKSRRNMMVENGTPSYFLSSRDILVRICSDTD
jgi:hypothetical protein